MSSVTTTTINTANSATPLTLRTGNTSGPSVIVSAADQITLKANSASNTVIANTSGVTTNVPLVVNGAINTTNTAAGNVMILGTNDVSREIQFSGNRTAVGYDGTDAFLEGGSGKGVSLYVNSTAKALTINATQNATFSNNITASKNITAANVTATSMVLGNSSISANGYTTLPNGLIFQWGIASVGATNTTLNLPITFPAVIYSVQLTPTSTDDHWVVSANTSAIVARSDVATTMYFMAIGA
jgi:hypothetical protein